MAKWNESNFFDKTLIAEHVLRLNLDLAKHFFGGLGFPDPLLSAIRFNDDIPETKARSILFEAVKTFKSGSEKSSDELLRQVQNGEAAYLRTPLRKFLIACEISCEGFEISHAVRFAGVELMFHKKMPEKLQMAREQKVEELHHSLEFRGPENYASLIASVDARCETAAYERSMRVVDLFRGIWNFHKNFQTSYRSSSIRQPINMLRLAPVQTVHEGDDFEISETTWYSFDWCRNPIGGEKDINGERVTEFQVRVVSILNAHPYKETLIDCFVRYARALDSRDLETAYLKLWSLLEVLTHSDKHETVVRRITFLYRDSAMDKQYLNHLRSRRNAFVHDSNESAFQEAHLFRLKRYFEQMLKFHLFFQPSFDSLVKAAEFLSLPLDAATIDESLRTLLMAKKYRFEDYSNP